MSIVKIVEEELKMEVREDIRAANITASIMPRAPERYDIHVIFSCERSSSRSYNCVTKSK